MNAIWKLSRRLMTLFFRDKSSIFFTILSSVLLLVVFLVFLTKAYTDPDLTELFPGYSVIFQEWLMAGILYTTSISAALNAMEQFPADQTQKISQDLMVTPISRGTVVGGYVLGSTLTAFVMTVFILILSYVNILIRSGSLPGVADTALLIGAILVISVFHTAFAFLLATFTKTSRSYSSLGIVFHSISGFLAGIYIPIGELAPAVKSVFAFSPFVHAASLLRKAYTFSSLGNLESGEYAAYVEGFREFTGITINIAGRQVSAWQSLLYLLALSAVFFLVSVRRISRSRERL